jgi:hypothetical protein
VKQISIINTVLLVCSGLILLSLGSCKTTKVISETANLRPMSTNKLIRNIENNAFDFDYLSIKKINCQFNNGKTKVSFRAMIQASKDKQIFVMLTKLNIPVARIWLTPDSVKFINYFERNYVLDDYSYLSTKLGMDLNFETIHSIISNNVFTLQNEKTGIESMIDSGRYVLQSELLLEPTKNRSEEKGRRTQRKSKNMKNDIPVIQTLYVDPINFKLLKINLNDVDNSRNLNIQFADYTELDNQLYPGNISLDFQSPTNRIELGVEMSNFSTEKEKDVTFKIPEKFTPLNLK